MTSVGRAAKRVVGVLTDRRGVVNTTLLLLALGTILPSLVVGLMQNALLIMVQHEISAVIDEAEHGASLQIDAGSYLGGSPQLDVAAASAVLANELAIGFSSYPNITSTSGLQTAVINPGSIDPVTGLVVTRPTVEVYGTVIVNVQVGGNQTIHIQQSSIDQAG